MERKIGEIFELDGEWYQCIIGHCNQCSFDEAGTCKFIGNPYCAYRNDKKLACFKKLEKVGEPTIINRKKVQLLKSSGLRNKCIYCCFLDKNSFRCLIPKMEHENETFYVEIKKSGIYTKVEELNVMEENKLNLKPFDIQKAREGKPVRTRDGRKARIICFDSNGGKPIVALVTECDDEEETPYKYHCDGSYNCQSIPSDNDLMILPEKKEGWINIIKTEDGGYCCKGEVNSDYNDAFIENINVLDNRGITVKIEWEE